MIKMKVKYIGKSFGVDALTDGKTYECVGIEPPFLRIIDDSEEDYLYSITSPGSMDEPEKRGRWMVVEDTADGQLQAVIGKPAKAV